MSQASSSPLSTFAYRTGFSQSSALATLFCTNFLEVLRTRLIYDIKACAPAHYATKPSPAVTHAGYTYDFVDRIYKIQQKCVGCLPYRNPFKSFFFLLRTEGVRYLLFSGMGQNVGAMMIRTGLFFPFFDFFKERLAGSIERELYSSVVSSALTRTITSLVSFPFEVTRIQKQSGKFDGSSLKNSFRIIANDKRHFAKVFSAFWGKEMTFSLVFWSVFEFLREKFDTGFQQKIACAFTAGSISALMTFPFDLVQTYRVIDFKSEKFNGNSLQLIKNVYEKNGGGFFVNSLILRTCRGAMMNGIYICLYEGLKGKLENRN